MSNWLFIVNSTAGNGRSGKHINELVLTLQKLGMKHKIELTRYPGHAALIAQEASCQYDTIIALGGDGTASEVAAGIAKSGNCKNVRFGIIPLGGGNDFCKCLQAESNIEKALIKLSVANTRKIDLAIANNQFFLNSFGIGFDAQVAALANKIKFLNGLPRYLLAVAGAMLKFKNYPLTIILDGKMHLKGRFLLAAVGNGRFAGGGFMLNPNALIDDDHLDIMLARDVTFLRVFSVLPLVLKGTHLKEREISFHRCRSIEVISQKPIPVYYDGEIPSQFNTTRINIRIASQKLNLLNTSDT